VTRTLITLSLCITGCGDASSSADVAGAGSAATSAGAANAGAAGTATAGASAAGVAGSGGGASRGGAGGASAGGTDGAASPGGAAGADGFAGDDGASQAIDHSLPGLIVVLGSSTAAGTGPKDPKNAWVPRYQAYLEQQFPNVKLVNLAVGGFTTYNIQPSDYEPPAGRPSPVDGKNITAALALKPNAIIVNTPTNDQALNIPVPEQMANYDRIATLTTAGRALLWVTTTQPRDFTDPAQLTNLMQARDAILQRFAPRALDFWTPFAEPDGTQKPEYAAGDGIHLNDAAHAILASIVIAAQVPETFLSATK
jgi:lysophospholipase L1-like esterase